MNSQKAAQKAAKTNAERQSEYRARKAENELKEIRGIFANKENTVKIKEFAAMLRGT